MSVPPASGATDEAVAAGARSIDRVRGRQDVAVRRRSTSGRGGVKVRVAAIAMLNAAILLLAALFGGLVMPLGMFGALAVMSLMVAVTVAILFVPLTPAPSPARLQRADIKALPGATARWLDAQRPLLPAPALGVVDRLDEKLHLLGTQMALLDDDAPAAIEVRRLVGEQLPAFVGDYARVPAGLRATPRNGRTPDQQLVEGLEVIEREVGQMSDALAQGDLDSLETRGRFLEIRYRDE